MGSEEIDIESLFSLKVDGLKDALKARNLSTEGSKVELQERLLQFVTTTSENSNTGTENGSIIDNKNLEAEVDSVNIDSTIELDEELINKNLEETLSPDASSISPIDTVEDKNNEASSLLESNGKEEIKCPEKKSEQIPKKVAILPTASSGDDRLANRSKRFGVIVSESEKKRSRLEKFGSGGQSTVEKSNVRRLSDTSPIESQSKKEQRAARFGTPSGTLVTTNLSENDKLKSRQERFSDEKIKQRQMRFGVV